VRRGFELHRQVVEQVSTALDTPIVFAADSSLLASTYIIATGREVLPIGGYLGNTAAPTLGEIQHYIDTGQLRGFLIPPESTDPRIEWILAHCAPVTKTTPGSKPAVVLYSCGST
jgi:hypothetical protein